MPINLNRKYSQVPQKESVPYSDKNGSLKKWLNNDNVTMQGNTFNGISQLVKTDSNGKLPESVIPDLALTETFIVNTEAEMLALPNLRIGDVCIILDDSITYILRAEPSNVLSNWSEIKVREIPVFTGATSDSNGQKGLVKQPLAGEENKYLKGDGTWYDIGTVLHSDLSNIEESGKEIIKNIASESSANIDLSNLSQIGANKVVPEGGEVYHVLMKKSNNTGDFGWVKANLEGCIYDSYLYNLTEDTNSINLPAIITDKKFITVILDNTTLTSNNYDLSYDGTILNFNSIITASVSSPSILEIKYFTSVSILEQLGPAEETYQGKIALASQEETDNGTNDTKAVTPLKLKNVLTNLDIENTINNSINSKKGIANGIASLDNNGKLFLNELNINEILQSINGFDSTKNQILKNTNGTFAWIEE
ncbi:MAG: hypothetical protein NC222_06125 [Staphylococcus sp.]|nr:hypothetical protein [Staphylococcus sp.]